MIPSLNPFLCAFPLRFRFYQIRCHMKAAPKLPVKIEVSIPRNEGEFGGKSGEKISFTRGREEEQGYFAPSRFYETLFRVMERGRAKFCESGVASQGRLCTS